MADAVTSQTILDGKRKTIIKLTNISDGTGEAAVLKVDVSALSPATAKVRINKIWYMTEGMAVRLLWDATTDVVALLLPQNVSGFLDFESFGGLINNAGDGITGDIMLTTVGHTAGDTYCIILELVKN